MATPYDENLRNHQNMLAYQQYLASRGLASVGSVQHIQNVVNGIQAQINSYTPPQTPQDRTPAPRQPTAAEIARQQEAIRAANEKKKLDEEARAILRTTFGGWGGMEGLIEKIDQLIVKYGNNTEVILSKVTETDEYKTRFKGLVDLRAQGITDIRNEAEYLGLERDYRGVFREAGMRDFLGPDGTQTQFDAIAELVTDYSVSVNEVRARVTDAARVVQDTSPEVAAALEEYYGLDAATLTEYVLDPVRTQNKINQISNATLLGASAARATLDIDRATAESVASLSGDDDVNVGAFTSEFGKAAVIRDATSRLANIEGSELTDDEVVSAQFVNSPDATKKIRGLQSRERARFSGRSGITSSSLDTNRG